MCCLCPRVSTAGCDDGVGGRGLLAVPFAGFAGMRLVTCAPFPFSIAHLFKCSFVLQGGKEGYGRGGRNERVGGESEQPYSVGASFLRLSHDVRPRLFVSHKTNF